MVYWIFKTVLSVPLYLFWGVKVEGREHIPRDGPVVLAANHQSFCDSFFLPLVVPRRVTYVAKAEYFEKWRTAWFFRAVGQIPMNRDGGDASQRALDTATGVLEGGGVLAIYPEGTRAPDERLHKGHTGVARLCLGCKVPVVPVGICGTRVVQPPGSRLMRPFRTITVRFGPPLDVADGTVGADNGQGSDGPDTADEYRRVTDALMAEIARLSGQEYVHTYAKRSKKETGPAPASGRAASTTGRI